MSSAKAVKQPVNLPEMTERKLSATFSQTELAERQARADAYMEWFNEWSAQAPSLADECGPL